MFSGSLSTLRKRSVPHADNPPVFGSESTWSLGNAAASYGLFLSDRQDGFRRGRGAFRRVRDWFFWSYRPYVIRENLPASLMLLVTQLAPIEFLSSVAPTGTMRIEWQGLTTMGVGQSMPFDSMGFVAPVSVDLPLDYGGFVDIERAVIVDVLGSVRTTQTLPMDYWASSTRSTRWLVQRYGVGDILHLWQVLQKASVGELPHNWSVLTTQGEDLHHLWRVIPPELIVLYGQDIQLPFGTIEKVG